MLTIHAISFFWVDQFIPHIQNWQRKNNVTELIPSNAKDLKYADKKIIEGYACANSWFKYEEYE
jgi:hypothetical protein